MRSANFTTFREIIPTPSSECDGGLVAPQMVTRCPSLPCVYLYTTKGTKIVLEVSGKPHFLTRLSARDNLIEFCLLESIETHTKVLHVKNAQTDISNLHFMFEFPCIISLYHIKNQQDATLEVLLISNSKITLHVSDAFCVHHQDY